MNFLHLLGLFGIHNLSFNFPLHEHFFFVLHPPPPLPNKFPNGLFLSNMDQN